MKFIKVFSALIAITGLLYFSFQSYKINITSWYLGLPQPQFGVVVEKNVMIPCTDGTLLASDIYRPDTEGKFPVIVGRTPYGKASTRHNYPLVAKMYAAQGFAFIMQDVRGKFMSEGDFIPYLFEAEDGYATVEWAGKAPWSNGHVALYGFSYLGSTAWLAATKKSPHLKTIVPLFCCQDTYQGWFERGVPYLKDMLFWISRYYGREEQTVNHDEIDKVLKKYPAVELDVFLNGKHLQTFQNYLHNPVPSEFWSLRSAYHKLDGVDIPILMYSGWYDRFTHSAVEEFQSLKAKNSSPIKYIIGPWVHDPTDTIGDLSFPKNAHFFAQFKTMLSWFNAWLKTDGDPRDDESSITYYVMGKNEWRHTKRWPPSNAEYEEYFLDAEISGKNGVLTKDKPIEGHPFSYIYDPDDPTPSMGSHMIYANGLNGPRLQNSLIEREDVLTFSSATLEEGVEVTGPLKLVLYVSSSAVDTDFCGRLVDRHPDGNSYFVQVGYLRMRYRDSFENPELITPEKVYEVEISMNSISHLFKKGHQIQLLVTSSDYPHHGRNLNTAEVPEFATEPVSADQKIHCGTKNPSRLVLPIYKTEIKTR